MKKLFQITAYGLILFFLFSTPGISQLQLQKTATSGSSAILTDENNGEWLRWDDGVNANAIGSSLWWTSAILFDTDDLAPYDGLVVTKVLVYQYDLSADAIIKIWQGPDIQNLTEYVSQSFTPQEKSWIEIELDMPYTIDASQKLVFGVEWDDLGDGYFAAGLDADSDYPGKGDLWLWGTYPGTWQYLHQGAIYGDWNKAIYVEPLETYTVTFEITDAKTGEDIDDGVVTLDDKTNEPGDYIFDNILPGTYEYMVEAEGYLTVEGEVEVIDADVNVEVEMEPVVTYYTVTFIVIDEEDKPVSNAIVKFDSEEYTTGADGTAVIEDVYPDVYDYMVEKEGYLTVEGEVEVVDADVTVEVKMEPEVYTVTFIVEDSETEEPVVNATVTFDGEEYITDNDGIAVIEDVYPSAYDYTVEKESYITVEGEVEVEEDTTVDIEMELETFTLTLIANPEEGGEVEGAGEYKSGTEVTLNAIPADNDLNWFFMVWTDEDGEWVSEEAEFVFIMPAEDVTLTAYFDFPFPPLKTLTLYAEPAEGGNVDGAGEYQKGEEVTITAKPAENFEFNNWSGDTEYVDDEESAMATVTMPDYDITLTAVFSYVAVKETPVADINVFPNPARNLFKVESNKTIKQIRLIDISGQVILNIVVDALNHEINVININPGVYFVQVQTANNVMTRCVQIVR